MGWFRSGAVAGMVLTVLAVTGCALSGSAGAQTVPSQNVVSPPPESSGTNPDSATSSNASIQPLVETEAIVDPASLLPDLPKLPPRKASLIGGRIDKLDRVRDEITMQVFGGGKMKVAFDTRTHIYLEDATGSTADLHRGERIYVDTILDGSTVFAKNIRLKSTGSAGETQGIVISFRKGELEMRDMLSPRPLKIRLNAQTQLIHGDHAAPTSELAPGSLVAVKFGAQQDGDVAREIKVLAVPGAAFTFVGKVTAVDLRLGLLELTSSTDNKTYEISLDSSLPNLDDSIRPGAEVTVISRFDGNRYVARSVTVSPQEQ